MDLEESGTNDEDKFQKALEWYAEKERKPFRFENCHAILSKAAKWRSSFASNQPLSKGRKRSIQR
jgi:hypothetical protein